MTPLIESLQLGQVPRVVGTIITPSYLDEWRMAPGTLPCDLVEFRLDGFDELSLKDNRWVEAGQSIEQLDIPVFATLRLASEGGKWTGLDSDRWPALENALYRLSGADVEIQSDLADLVAKLAAEKQKLCILSYHNFQVTPPIQEMRDLIKRAHDRGAIGKIAVTVNTPEDLDNLQSLLSETWSLPICLIGMGPLGRESRLTFPLKGSCLTYGYLDTPGAPGQYSAQELTEHFRKV